MSDLTPYYSAPAGSPVRVEIYLGDCREHLLSLAPPAKHLFIHADPPYGVDEQTDRAARRRGAAVSRPSGRFHLKATSRPAIKRHDWEPIVGDDEPFDPSHLMPYIEADVRTVIWGWNFFAHLLPPTWAPIIWNKRPGMSSDDNADSELAWTNLPGRARNFNHTWRGVCRSSETGVPHLGPAQKPRAYCDWLWSGRGRGAQTARAGDLIVVPYAGTGPEVEAAIDWGFDVIAFDLSSAALDVVIEHRVRPALARARVSIEERVAFARRPPKDQLALFERSQASG